MDAVGALVAARVVYAVNWLNFGAIFVLMEPTLGVGVLGLGEATASFYLGIGLAQVPAGLAAARFGPKRTVVTGIMMSSLATIAIGMSTTILDVAILRFVVGVGMALVFAPAVVLVARYLGGGRTGLGVGIFNSAFDVGGLLGLYGWIVLATRAGWQGSLQLSGGLGVLTGLLVAWRVPGDSPDSRGAVTFAGLRSILANGRLVLLGVGTLGIGVGNLLISNFMVYYLNHDLGLDLPAAGLITAMVVAAPIVTALWGGRIYDRAKSPRRLMAASGAVLSSALVLAVYPSVATAALCAVLGGSASGVGFTVAFAWAKDLNTSGEEFDGLAIAWVNGISLTGAFLPPLVFSRIAEGVGYGAAWAAGSGVCLALVLPVLLLSRKSVPRVA